MRFRRQPPVGENGVRTRETNVAFANALIETEIAQRNARKDAQENTARGVIVTAGLVLTLLLGLANDAGVFSSKASIVARIALVATVLLGAGSAACAIGTLWPRKYDRLGKEGLDAFNQNEFLDQPSHRVTGMVVATRIGIAKTMDQLHEGKAKWLKWSFALLALAFMGLIVQGAALALDPPAPKTTPPVRILIQQR
jgi:hypothetical protein